MKRRMRCHQSLAVGLTISCAIAMTWCVAVFAEETSQPSITVPDEQATGDDAGEIQERGTKPMTPHIPQQHQPQSIPLPMQFPDLTPWVISGTCLGNGGIIKVSLTNKGTAPSGPFNTTIYSTTASTSFRIDQLLPGSFAGREVTIACPLNPSSGYKCIVNVLIDANHEVAESNETNNSYSFLCGFQ